MPSVQLTARLRDEYNELFNACVIRLDRAAEVESIIIKIDANRSTYDKVEAALGVPWYVVGVIHNMESSLNFTTHLHNGDPLTARTVQVPAGRPKLGNPPFTWEESAEDALTLKRLGADTDWTLAGSLYRLEQYNGWGYRLHHPEVLSPYLWSNSNQYTSGKYIADGTWSDTAVSKQCGAAVILRRMVEKLMFEFVDQPLPEDDSEPLVVAHSNRKSKDPAIVARAEELQRWLNSFEGIFVKVDGVPGDRTSDAFKRVTGAFLPGDPRA
jgi:lysozyme family protein